jgi:hypothetical protein
MEVVAHYHFGCMEAMSTPVAFRESQFHVELCHSLGTSPKQMDVHLRNQYSRFLEAKILRSVNGLAP